MKQMFPQAVKATLWSYDTDKMDLTSATDRHRITLNILNHGTMEAVEWLWQNFSEKEIKDSIRKSYASEWNSPSLDLWSLIYEIKPERSSPFNYSYGNPLEHTR